MNEGHLKDTNVQKTYEKRDNFLNIELQDPPLVLQSYSIPTAGSLIRLVSVMEKKQTLKIAAFICIHKCIYTSSVSVSISFISYYKFPASGTR